MDSKLIKRWSKSLPNQRPWGEITWYRAALLWQHGPANSHPKLVPLFRRAIHQMANVSGEPTASLMSTGFAVAAALLTSNHTLINLAKAQLEHFDRIDLDDESSPRRLQLHVYFENIETPPQTGEERHACVCDALAELPIHMR